MIRSRLKRYEEKQQIRRLYGAVAGIIAMCVFIAVFGLKLLIGFSVFVDKLRGNTTQITSLQTIVLPPEFDPLPVATNSGSIKISGKGQPDLTLILYVNEAEIKRTPVLKDGTFAISTVSLSEGLSSISANLMDEKKNFSELSEIVTISYSKKKPFLDITAPDDNTQITGERNLVLVAGKTDETSSVSINDRFVVVRNDGSFSFEYPLSEGDTVLKIQATDIAGNTTVVERKATYRK